MAKLGRQKLERRKPVLSLMLAARGALAEPEPVKTQP
jgi:hypothetical protein